jgi:hypothetical protein
MPFELGRTAFVSHRKMGAGDALTVDFPSEIHTHCRRQTFYLDRSGLIVRHDYTAEVAGSWARGCHRWQDYTDCAGFQVAGTRDVRASLFGSPSPFVALHATLNDFAWQPD